MFTARIYVAFSRQIKIWQFPFAHGDSNFTTITGSACWEDLTALVIGHHCPSRALNPSQQT